MTDSRARLLAQAARLFHEGPVDAAIAAHRAFLQAHSDNPDIWFNLSLLERRARHADASLAALDEALARGIMGAEEVWLQRAVVLSDDMGDPHEARAALKQALSIAPDYVPALLNAGNLEEDSGDRAAAEAFYRDALVAAPGHPLALSRLAGVVPIDKPGDPLLDLIRDALRSAGGIPLAEADLGFALGAALDRIGEYDAAFDAYVAANRASRTFAASQGQRYDRAALELHVGRLVAMAGPSIEDAGENAPLFICGMVRSGSTLLERMLGRHDALTAGGEIDAIPAMAAQIVSYPEGVKKLGGSERGALATRYREETRHRHVCDRTLIDKRPDNIFHLGLIRSLFPGARIIRTLRDPLDNVLSAYFLHADPSLGWATDLGDIAHYLAQERRLAANAREWLGPAMCEMRYEQLVDDPRGMMKQLLDFCGLGWQEQVLDPTGGDGVVKTASVWQVREPIHRRSAGRWRNYAHRLGDLPRQFENFG